MKPTVVIYDSSTGTCQAIAEKIAKKLGVEAVDVTDLTADIVNDNDNLILGASTWGSGDIQDDWYEGVEIPKGAGLSGKMVALFRCGDCESYGGTFCSGMPELYQVVEGANIIGAVSTDGYTFDDGDAAVDGKFAGLALDDLNEEDKADERIDAWTNDIKGSLQT